MEHYCGSNSDERAVAALRDELLAGCERSVRIDQGRIRVDGVLDATNTARFILDRERALVAAMEKVVVEDVHIVDAERTCREALAAHRARQSPPEQVRPLSEVEALAKALTKVFLPRDADAVAAAIADMVSGAVERRP